MPDANLCDKGKDVLVGIQKMETPGAITFTHKAK
jgi:hypothetical protein